MPTLWTWPWLLRVTGLSPISDALKIVGKIVKEHAKLTKHRLAGRSVILLAPFNGVVGPERWTANTRGASVVLLARAQCQWQGAVGEVRCGAGA